MKLHSMHNRTLPAQLRGGLLAAAHPAQVLSGCVELGINQAIGWIEKGQERFVSVALAGSGSM